MTILFPLGYKYAYHMQTLLLFVGFLIVAFNTFMSTILKLKKCMSQGKRLTGLSELLGLLFAAKIGICRGCIKSIKIANNILLIEETLFKHIHGVVFLGKLKYFRRLLNKFNKSCNFVLANTDTRLTLTNYF